MIYSVPLQQMLNKRLYKILNKFLKAKNSDTFFTSSTKEKTFNKVSSLNPNKSTGPYKIHSEF